MAAPKGNQFSKGVSKGKIGRGTREQEFERVKDIIKEQTIEELAEDKVYKQITILQGRNEKDRQGVKEIALPVYLKSKADKKELSGSIELKTITGMEITKDEDKIQDKNR